MVSGLRLAFSTLTALPIGPPDRVDRAVAGRAMACAPLVGVALGASAGAVAAMLAWWTSDPMIAAVGGGGAVAALDGGRHLCGVAGYAEGSASGAAGAQ